MNNGNVTRAAVGVAKRLSGRLKSILEAFVLGVKHGSFWHTWGQGSFRAKTLQGQAKAGAGRGRGRQGQGQAGQAGRQGQTKSPRREAGGRDRGGDLGRDQLGHLEAVEGIHSRRYRGNGAFSEQGRDFGGLVVRLEENRLRGQTQRLSGDLRRLGGGCGGGGGDALAFKQSGEGDQLRGRDGLGFHLRFFLTDYRESSRRGRGQLPPTGKQSAIAV